MEAVDALSMKTASKKARDICTKPHPTSTSKVTNRLVSTKACITNMNVEKNKKIMQVTM